MVLHGGAYNPEGVIIIEVTSTVCPRNKTVMSELQVCRNVLVPIELINSDTILHEDTS